MNNNLYGVSGQIKAGKDLLGEMLLYIGNDENNATFKGFEYFQTDIGREEKYQIKKCADKLKDCVCHILGCTRDDLEDREFKERVLGEEWWLYTDGIHQEPYLNGNMKKLDGYNIKIQRTTPRLMLQLLGTEGGREVIHPNIWVNALFSKYKSHMGYAPGFYSSECGKCGEDFMGDKRAVRCENCSIFYPNWIITDVRFPNNEGRAISTRGGLLIGVRRLFRLRFPEYEDLIDCTMDGHAIPEELKDVNPKLYEMLTHESEVLMGDHSWCDVVINNNGSVEDLFNDVLKVII
jgi:hypothetical protein